MGPKIQVFFLVISIQILATTADTDAQELVALRSLTEQWQNKPASWDESDPCTSWEGIRCNNAHITSIKLASMNLAGRLSGDIQELTKLQILDLSYNTGLTGPLPSSIGNLKELTNLILVGCGFSGAIPNSIGSLQQLHILSLNSNNFSGLIPPSIGTLSNLYWLDLAENKLSGPIPVSNSTTPGLDMLVNTKHFHFGKNQLSGEIPPQLFSSNMTLIHVLFESNSLSGSIPSTVGLVSELEVLRLDRNLLKGPVPTNISKLTKVQELSLSNNQLTGPLPNLAGMEYLNSVDMSNNSFDASGFPKWLSSMLSLTTLKMENTMLEGQIPAALFNLPELQTVILSNNKLNGTLYIGSDYSSQLQLIDLQNNDISDFSGPNEVKIEEIILVGNTFCYENGATKKYCSIQQSNSSSYSTSPRNCLPPTCSYSQTSSPNCKCGYPYMGTLVFRSPSFSDFGNLSIYTSLEKSLMDAFQRLQLPVDSLSLSNPTLSTASYFVLSLEVFPSNQDHFNRTGVSEIAFVLSNQTFKPPHGFGPFYFKADSYGYFPGYGGSHKSSSSGIVIGAAIGGSLLVLLALLAGIYAFHQKRRAEKADKLKNPFASWDSTKGSGDVPQLKGARCFSFEELRKCTNNFSNINEIGSGGYGKVYRGTLPTGQLLAIKRAQQGSMQGGLEFKTEIELLSRVHHKNVVSLIGFCFEQGEQMLVYEYIANGTLKESLSGKSGIRLDWIRRLRIALGAARGLQYLHELANPPIIHRDIKSNNILLDQRLNAKVADFGLSKLVSDVEKGHITTQVKGTMGYLDPEYYMTQQLTEKSDVYSFGVLLLEIITARQPIEKGTYIVREVRQKMDKSEALYNLDDEILDPTILGTPLEGLEKFVDLALRCVQETAAQRPTMGEVVKEIENIMQIAGLNPNADSASTSSSYEEASKGYHHPYTDEGLFVYSAAFSPQKPEPQ
ncbi:Non-specific serine/threonine protein kinase [Bertholletia excelsa]